MEKVRVGCSGWSYKSWKGGLYPQKLPARRWLERYAEVFDTVEVNATFYRLQKEEAVAGWAEQTPEGFLFTVKASRYLTHMKRLRGIEQGVERFWEPLRPLREAGKLGPVLWQLPESFERDDEVLAGALDLLPPATHCFEFRHPSWFEEDVFALLAERGASLAIGDDARRPLPQAAPVGEIAFVRFHYGRRGRRGNYSEAEVGEWRRRVAAWRSRRPVFAYFNNDWEGFAPANARLLRHGLSSG
jgi:uncharacterized protein YecE (DUF72 family)